MKKLLFLAILLQFAARADTNTIQVFTTKDGISYTNARVDSHNPIEAHVFYDGGIARIALTNFPNSLQAEYPYDPTNASRYLAAEMKKKAMADKKSQEYLNALREKQLADAALFKELAKTAGDIRILEWDGRYDFSRCASLLSSGKVYFYVKDLPADLGVAMGYFQKETFHDESDFVMAAVDGSRTRQSLSRMNFMDSYMTIAPVIHAFNTKQKYNGLEVWQWVP